MALQRFDVVILGAGFAGSLTALVCQRLGLRPILIDKGVHPRFAIGESSTPAANLILQTLAQRYDLPRVLPLAKFGPWQRSYPQLGCGLKRGFSYFHHLPGEPFRPCPDHANELLVTASAADEQGDTHWLRADVDQFLAAEARGAGVPVWEGAELESLQPVAHHWVLRVHTGPSIVEIAAEFLIDATGPAGVVPKALGVPSDGSRLLTRSRAIYSHFKHVLPWSNLLAGAGARIEEHPFCCDDAAQHHVLDGAWVWMLRFLGGLTSVGIVLDEHRYPLNAQIPVLDEWNSWLGQYPSLADLLQPASFAELPGHLVRTGRLQRRWGQVAGPNWALLPHTAGFIDPLHSTGIAHSLSGIERLANCLGRDWHTDRFPSSLKKYSNTVEDELSHIDRLVAGCFASFGRFPLLASYSMLYFAAATTYERRRHDDPDSPGAFLGADDPQFVAVVRDAWTRLGECLGGLRDRQQCQEFAHWLMHRLQPYNHVGLGDRSVRNMYRYTAADPPAVLARGPAWQR